MPSYVKLLDEYLSNAEKSSLRQDYNSENRDYDMSMEEKNNIFGPFYQFKLQTLLQNCFGAYPHHLQGLGSGTQGIVIALHTKKAKEGFRQLVGTSTRTHGPIGTSFPQDMVLKVQLIPKASSYAEKRMLREEYIMAKLQKEPTNVSINAPTSIIPYY